MFKFEYQEFLANLPQVFRQDASPCYLKLKTIHKYFLCPYKRQISMLRFIALRGVRPHRNVAHLQHTGKTKYIGIEVVL